jgi:TRAP-type C4-dicarboxylate transport system permease small subunit
VSDGNQQKPLWVRTINGINEVSGYISGFLILLSSLVVLHQVSVRYFFGLPSIWQTEMSIYLLMFSTFVGGAYALKHNGHVGVDLVSIKLPPRAQAYLRIATSILCLGLTVIVAWKGFNMWWEATENGWKSDTLWGPKLTYPYAILPLGMMLMSLQYLALVYDDVQGLKGRVSEDVKTDTPSSYGA